MRYESGGRIAPSFEIESQQHSLGWNFPAIVTLGPVLIYSWNRPLRDVERQTEVTSRMAGP